MKFKTSVGVCLFLCLGMILPACASDAPDLVREKRAEVGSEAAFAPIAVPKDSRFHFESVIEGSVITHDFIIQNTGNAPLRIERVKTSCGCTTANYTKEIGPGANGVISINGKTMGYAGREFSKTITVFTNDPKNPQIAFYIRGKVEPFALIQPDRVYLRGEVGKDIQSQVTITPLKKYPFSIIGSYAENLDDKITFKLTNQGSNYILNIKNVMKTEGGYKGAIHLKTDSALRPEINIYVSGIISPSHKVDHNG